MTDKIADGLRALFPKAFAVLGAELDAGNVTVALAVVKQGARINLGEIDPTTAFEAEMYDVDRKLAEMSMRDTRAIRENPTLIGGRFTQAEVIEMQRERAAQY